jgi:hypothetical protein
MIKKTLLIVAIAVFAGQNFLKAQDDNSTQAIRTSVPFLTIAPDSRSGGMGDAGVATTPDINSQHWNASKYVFVEDEAGVSLTYTPWLRSLGVNDLNLVYLSGFKKFGKLQAVSASLRYFNLGEITEMNANGDATGNKIRPNEYALDLGYSRLFSDNFSAGLVFRYIHSDIANGTSGLNDGIGATNYDPANSYAADISAYYEKPIKVKGYDANMAFGLNISNIGTKISYSGTDGSGSQFIPANLRLGGRYDMNIDEFNSMGVTLDLNKLLVPIYDTNNMGPIEGILNSFSDAPGGFKEEMHEIMYSFGLEYWYMKQFAIRAGYFHENVDKGNRKYYTAGVGLRLNVFALDFSYLFPAQGGRNNPLANTIRISLGFRFE